METKDRILDFVKKRGVIRAADVVRLTGISRQGAAKHLRELSAAKKLLKEGSTRNSRYLPFDPRKAALSKSPSVTFTYQLRGLEEDRVFERVRHQAKLRKKLSPAAFKIVQYAFTEMLNNAIDHSRAAKVKIELRFADGALTFIVSDRGIGAFESVRKKFGMKNIFEAAEHLLKGRQTTDPEHHSGQGIFFTSRIADHFTLDSGRLRLDVNNLLGDVSLLDIKSVRGTQVSFSIRQKSRKDLKALFDAYTDGEMAFDRTEVRVRLSRKTGEYISRSEARRLLFGLEKFKRVVLDFDQVPGIGQGFADEIFRVFARKNPQIRIETAGMSPSVAFLVNRARQESLQ